MCSILLTWLRLFCTTFVLTVQKRSRFEPPPPPPPSLPSPLDVATPQARATKKTVIEHAKKVSKGNFISKSLQGPINLKFYASLQGANILSWSHCFSNSCLVKLLGKFFKAIYDIQGAVSKEFNSVDSSVSGKNLDQRLENLEEFLKAALEGRSIDLARTTLGKGFLTFTKVII